MKGHIHVHVHAKYECSRIKYLFFSVYDYDKNLINDNKLQYK